MPEPIPISEIRQLHYCERIPFYHLHLGLRGARTHRMSEGRDAELRALQLERRRALAWYGLESGVRKYHVPVSSACLGLSGICDMVIASRAGPIPVEVKSAGDANEVAHRDQLIAYSLCLEEEFRRAVPFGTLLYVGGAGTMRTQRVVEITPTRRRRLMRIVNRLRTIEGSDTLPNATEKRSRCRSCEFRRFCADVG